MNDLPEEIQRLILEHLFNTTMKVMEYDEKESKAYLKGQEDTFNLINKIAAKQQELEEDDLFSGMNAKEFNEFMREQLGG